MTTTKLKETTQDKVKEAFKLIEQGVNAITSSDQYKEFLKFSSRFYNYSMYNQLLIWVQKPNATFVAGFQTWKKMGRFVKKGEKGIRILAPIRISATRVNGEGKEEVVEYNKYQTISVFDISQTEGDNPLPSLREFVKEVKGETELYSMIRRISPFPVEELEDCKGADGYYSLKTKEIKILSTNSTAHKLLTLIHEVAHGLLHGDRKSSPSHKVMEIEAESIGFIVCHALGIDTSVNSFGYLASYGGKATMNLVEDSKERINMAAKKILSDFENAYMPKEEITQ